MITYIKKITVKVLKDQKLFKVLAEFKKDSNEFYGFTIHKTLNEALQQARARLETDDDKFICLLDGYTVEVFESDGSKKTTFTPR